MKMWGDTADYNGGIIQSHGASMSQSFVVYGIRIKIYAQGYYEQYIVILEIMSSKQNTYLVHISRA